VPGFGPAPAGRFTRRTDCTQREHTVAQHEFDIVVIGMGPGGEDAAERLAAAGLSVAAVEERLVGGECPYWGCIPSKMMIRGADLLAEGRRIPGLAGRSQVSPSWAPVATRIRDEATDNWDDRVAADRFTGKGGHLFRGHGQLIAPDQVQVGDDVLTARRGVIINSGTAPAVPPIRGLAGTPFWTNHEAIETERVPESLIVLGGGAIGAELTQVFSRFGAHVTVVEAAGRLLAAEEPESSRLLAEVFGREDIDVRTGVTADQVHYDETGFTVTLSHSPAVRAAALLVATGRRADLSELGVGVLGLDPEARTIPVNDRMRVRDGVWALGDVVGHGAFTHMSMYEADIVVADILGTPHHPAEYHAVPRVTFTDPEIGSVGMSEAQARAAGLPVATALAPVPQSTRGWIHKAGNDGFIKLVADTDQGILVGATSAGPCGGEVLSLLTLAVHARIPVTRLREMIYAYPTFHRTIEAALAELDAS
jgi:pyruvate/2-oxoglutarate dehydrogenase complex dihydrolipoamide dehydrogenase (E3) component